MNKELETLILAYEDVSAARDKEAETLTERADELLTLDDAGFASLNLSLQVAAP